MNSIRAVSEQLINCSSISHDIMSLQALMTRGGEMVGLAQELRARSAASAARAGPAAADSSAADDIQMDAGMQQDLVDLGIYSPVTKSTAGKQYHRELARQLAEFLSARLVRAGGMLALHDVYCLFNRCAACLCALEATLEAFAEEACVLWLL